MNARNISFERYFMVTVCTKKDQNRGDMINKFPWIFTQCGVVVISTFVRCLRGRRKHFHLNWLAEICHVLLLKMFIYTTGIFSFAIYLTILAQILKYLMLFYFIKNDFCVRKLQLNVEFPIVAFFSFFGNKSCGQI